MKAPSIKMHFYFSLVKSTVRIAACGLGGFFKDYTLALLGLAVAELIGIFEEVF